MSLLFSIASQNPVTSQVGRHKSYVNGFSGTIDDESYLRSVYQMEFDNNRFYNLAYMVDKRTGYLNASGNAERWFDLSTNELSPAQSTASSRPSIDLTGLGFDGSDFFALSNPSHFQIGGAITLECWVKFSNTSNNLFGIFGSGNSQGGGSNTAKLLSVDNDTTNGPDHMFEIGNGTSNADPGRDNTGFAANTYMHFVGTWDGTTGSTSCKLYKNGSLYESVPGISSPTLTDRDWNIGRCNRPRYLEGGIARCALWNKELSSSEVTELYNLQSSYL